YAAIVLVKLALEITDDLTANDIPGGGPLDPETRITRKCNGTVPDRSRSSGHSNGPGLTPFTGTIAGDGHGIRVSARKVQKLSTATNIDSGNTTQRGWTRIGINSSRLYYEWAGECGRERCSP